MDQSRLGSLYEAFINIAIGYWINFAGNALILPLFGFHVTLAQNLQIGVMFTVISVARQYVIRRWFNARLKALAARMAGGAQ